MSVIEVLLICLLNLLSFVLGARIGQKTIKGEKIEINPIKATEKAIADRREKREKEAEEEYFKTIMHNIDTYDGTSNGQMTIPNRK